MRVLGIITARGGSKRLPGKNIKEFHGKPLLAWSVEVGQQAGVFDEFILSTDDAEIAEVGKRAGIEVPFMRPAELASDTSSSYDAVIHAVSWMKENKNYEPDWIVLLEPTAPGRQEEHIRDVVAVAEKNVADSIIGITEMPGHFSFSKELKIDGESIVSRVHDGVLMKDLIHRNQDVPKSYYINSTVYAFKTKNLFDGNNSLWGDSTYGYVMDSKYAFDIDTQEDWLVAEIKMKKLLEEKRS